MRNYIIPILFIIASCSINKKSIDTPEVNNSSKTEVASKKISFYLTNTSSNSIPLLIPSVMNPNLSPNSSSAVSLRVGQEVFFRYKLKKYLLIKVDNKINSGDKIEVSDLLKNRKKELGLK